MSFNHGPKTEREYQVRYGAGDYFAGWLATEWDTIKRVATWSKDIEQIKWVSDQELVELIKGFGRLATRSRERS